MTLLLTEVYDALRAAHVPDDVARKAATALGDVVGDIRLLKWMVATNIALTLGGLGGLYALLFQLASRLPR